MVGLGALQLARSLVLHLEEEGGLLPIGIESDGAIQSLGAGLRHPAIAAREEIQSPQACIVGLRADDGLGTEEGSEVARQLVGTADVSREDGDDVAPRAVDVDHRWIGVLVPDQWSDATHTDTHSSDEDPPFECGELLGYERLDMIDVLDPFPRMSGEEASIGIVG